MKITQNDRIVRHLKDYGSITSLEAMTEYGVMRLASRINDLKRQGYNIITEDCLGKDRYGHTCKFAKYELIEEAK